MLRPLLPQHGNLALLRLDLIPEATLACRMLKRWSHNILYNLDPTRPELQDWFLTNFFKATTLGHLINKPSMDRTLDRVYCVSRYYHPALLVPHARRDINALHGLVDLLKSRQPSALTRGTLFLRYAVFFRSIPFTMAILIAQCTYHWPMLSADTS